MTLTTCIKKAGSALHEDDKSAILAAARKYRKEGMSADEAGRKAVTDQIAKVQVMLEGYGKPAAADEKKAAASTPQAAAGEAAADMEYPLAPPGSLYEETNKPITMMSPDAYLAAVRPLDIDEASRDNIEDLKRHILSGKTLDPLHIRANGKEDGRHRAVAAKELGIQQVPVVDERKNVAPGEVADKFGQSLPPARRAMAAKLDEDLSDDDIAKRPLSEIWPLAENEAIEDTFAAAVAHAARAEVPAKPRQPYKLRRWVEKVKSVRELAGNIVSGRVTREAMIEQINTQHRTLKDWLSKVLLLEQIQRDQWKRIGSVEERPDAFTYEDGKQVPSPMLRLEVDGKAQWLRGDSGIQGEDRGTVEGNKAAILAMLAGDAPDKRMEFEIRGKSGGPYKINKKGDPEYRPLMTFPTVEEARRAINVDYDSLSAAWEAVKARDNITERDLRNAENRPRSGKDHRGGKDVDAQQFQDTFGFRGGEFGKWVQQGKGDKERQALLNSAYDALMDLSDIVGVPPRAISLNGTLGMAFGSRGSGWASAHFEPSNLVINLTKTRGAGSLAHEWLHALDNYFGRMRRGGEEAKFTGDKKQYNAENFITHRPEPLMVRKDRARGFPPLTMGQLEARRQRRKEGTRTGWPPEDAYDADKWERDPSTPEGVRPEVERAFADLVAELNASPMARRAQTLDKGRDGYWSSTLEMAARAFESFVMARMHESGYHNDFLVNVKKAEEVAKDPARYPYLMAGEIKPIADAFGALFDTIQTRETEGGNVAMFSRATPFIATDTSDGFPTYANAEAGIDLSFPHKAERFEVIDVPGDVVNYAIMPLDGFDSFGYVELLVQNGRPVSLLDIEVTPQGRRNGIGRKVIETLLAANPGADLEISNIVPEARGFWARMGVPEQNVEGAYDGILNWQTYSQAQDGGPTGRAAQEGRGARAKRDAGAEGSPTAPGGQVPQGLTRAEAQALLAALESAQGQILQRPITAERAREIAQAMGATVNVVQSVDEIPAAKRESLLAQAPDGRVRGAFFRDDASVWLVMDNVHSEAEAAFVILHEAFHRGLAATIGADSKRLLRQMYLTNPRLNQLAREQMKMHGIGQDEAIEEALADLAGRGQARDLRGWSKLLDMIRGWLSKVGKAIGLDIKWSDDMIEDFVAGISRAGLEGGVHVNPRVQGAMASRAPTSNPSTWSSVRDARLPAGYIVNDFIDKHGKLSWWSKSVGTMHNLARRSPEFKRVYDSVQEFLGDVSLYATEAANLAPSLLPKLERFRDLLKTPLSAEDTKAISPPIFEGTLSWTRDENGEPVKESDPQKAGIVWTERELRDRFKLNDKQVGLYREFRAAVDKSLSDLVISDMLRFAGRDADPVRAQVLAANDPETAAGILLNHLAELADGSESGRAAVLTDTGTKIAEKAEQARRLMDRGYAPLMRFGHYTLDAVDSNGDRLYFGLFESEAEANRMARALSSEYPGATIQQGTMSDRAYQMFAGVSPETLELFGDMLGLESQGNDAASQAFQTYLKLVKANRSAMKRLIERKGVAGFSEDAGRVLAGFVYSNARQTSKNLHFGEITQATQDIADQKGKGELLDAAVDLHQYVTNPREEAQKIKGLMFTQFLGGSVASAFVNLTQPVAVAFPYLSQWGGAAKAATRMSVALKDALAWETRGRKTGDAKLDAALKRAEEEGIVSPQEVHSLIAQAGGAGALKAGDGTALGDALAKASNFKSKLMLAWGRPFSLAEQFNRRATFIAAYRTAVEEGLSNPDGFAAEAIADTMFTYNKGNRPTWARGSIGGVLFTFKTYSISYVELMMRMAQSGKDGRKAALIGLATLALMSGLQGLPGADDLDDLIDGALQRLGYNFSSKAAKREFLASILGEDGARFMLTGLSGLPGAPIDVSGRLGIGNLIPGTGLLTKKADYTQDALEILGPAGSVAKQVGAGVGKIAEGEVSEAIKAILPVAAANAVKAADMASTGMYRDMRGRKVIDVDAIDSAFKAMGFQPSDVSRVQKATSEVQRMVALTKIREAEIADKWARGMFEKDEDLVAEARDELARWNESNPATRIKISTGQIIERLRNMRMGKEERIAKTAPREIRDAVRRELERTP